MLGARPRPIEEICTEQRKPEHRRLMLTPHHLQTNQLDAQGRQRSLIAGSLGDLAMSPATRRGIACG